MKLDHSAEHDLEVFHYSLILFQTNLCLAHFTLRGPVCKSHGLQFLPEIANDGILAPGRHGVVCVWARDPASQCICLAVVVAFELCCLSGAPTVLRCSLCLSFFFHAWELAHFIFLSTPQEQLSGDPFVATRSNPQNQCFADLAD